VCDAEIEGYDSLSDGTLNGFSCLRMATHEPLHLIPPTDKGMPLAVRLQSFGFNPILSKPLIKMSKQELMESFRRGNI
jgi:hypothetical protein